MGARDETLTMKGKEGGKKQMGVPAFCTMLCYIITSSLKSPLSNVGKPNDLFHINKAHQISRWMGFFFEQGLWLRKKKKTKNRWCKKTDDAKDPWNVGEKFSHYCYFKKCKLCHREQNLIHLGYLLMYFKTQHGRRINALGSSTLDFQRPDGNWLGHDFQVLISSLGFLLGLISIYLFAKTWVLLNCSLFQFNLSPVPAELAS